MENSNRKIAFRAWVKEKKIMVPISGLLFDNDRLCEILGNFLDGWGSSDTESVELMQFTGLKDRNGVEIYEGDFVSNGKNTWQVEFMGGSFWLSKKHDILGSESTPMYRALLPSKFMNLDYPDGEIGTVEVVGNIYENQELIK